MQRYGGLFLLDLSYPCNIRYAPSGTVTLLNRSHVHCWINYTLNIINPIVNSLRSQSKIWRVHIERGEQSNG